MFGFFDCESSMLRVVIVGLFPLMDNNPLSKYTVIYLSILSLVDIWIVCSFFWLL
jgi:hypothetical protein